MTPKPEIDADNPLWTRDDFAAARPAPEILPARVADQLLNHGAMSRDSTNLIAKALHAEGPLLARSRFAPNSLSAAA